MKNLGLGGHIFVFVLAIMVGLGLCFWEAFVALQILKWHVPLARPGWLNVWTLGWLNMAVSVIIRQFRFKSSEEKAQEEDGSPQFWVWAAVPPAMALLTAWVAKAVWG